MHSFRLTAGLFAVLFLLGTGASAAPPSHHVPGKAHKQHRPPAYNLQHKARPGPHRLSPVPKYQPPSYRTPHKLQRKPPQPLRRDIHRHRQYLQSGPILPPHVRLMVGHPLPHGWHHRLPPRQARYLPYYPGYEWHSAGRDLILVAVGSGIIYSILDNVLN